MLSDASENFMAIRSLSRVGSNDYIGESWKRKAYRWNKKIKSENYIDESREAETIDQIETLKIELKKGKQIEETRNKGQEVKTERKLHDLEREQSNY